MLEAAEGEVQEGRREASQSPELDKDQIDRALEFSFMQKLRASEGLLRGRSGFLLHRLPL